MHLHTLHIEHSVLLALFTLLTAVNARLQRNLPGVGYFVLYNVLALFGSLAVTLRGEIPDVLSITVGNILVLAAYLALYKSMSQLFGLRRRLLLVPLAFLLAYKVNRTDKGVDPTFLSAAFRLKEGQISPVIKSKFGYHIIMMVSRSGDDATVRHILKIPQITGTEVTDAESKLDSVRANLISGTVQFGEAVLRYTEDEAAKFTGGMKQCSNGTYCKIDELDKEEVKMLKDLKVNEYSKPIAFTDDRGKQGVRIMYLKSRSDPHRENLRDDYNKVANRAIEEKKYDAMEKWFNTKIPSYYIRIDESEKSCSQLGRWMTSAAKN